MSNQEPQGVAALVGKTLSAIRLVDDRDDMLYFTLNTGEEYRMWHSQDCCEQVRIADICGDLDDLIGSPLLMAEEVTSENVNPDGMVAPDGYHDESFTWTFYKFATVKGYVTIRWYGSSNGYYSETVDFEKVDP